MFFRSEDPNSDFDRWDYYQQRQLARLPRCAECKERIEDENCYEFDDDVVCPECVRDYIEKHHSRRTEDFII